MFLSEAQNSNSSEKRKKKVIEILKFELQNSE